MIRGCQTYDRKVDNKHVSSSLKLVKTIFKILKQCVFSAELIESWYCELVEITGLMF